MNYSSIIWNAVVSAFDWLISFFDSLVGVGNGVPLLVGIIAVNAVFIFILSPLLHSGSSDKASRKKGGNDE